MRILLPLFRLLGLGASLAALIASAAEAPAPGARGGRGEGGGNRERVSAELIAQALEGIAPARGPYAPTWESVSTHQAPEWYRDAKFGIGMHWGLYAVPGQASEWYVRHMYSNAEIIKWHAEKFGPQDKFGYKDFIPLFTAAKWNPDEWAELFAQAGARYVMPTAEHHDGFALWDSALTKIDAKDMGPKRDLIGDLAAAVRRQGMKFGVTNHRIENFTFINPADNLKHDLLDPQWADFYNVADRSPEKHRAFLHDWVKRNFELIDKYQLDTLWWDNGVNARVYDPLKLAVFAHFYNRGKEWGKEVTMLTKGEASLGGHVQDYERIGRAPKELSPTPFETHDSPGYRWGYLERDEGNYWPVSTLVSRLVESVCRNGNLLFNLGPRADGTLPDGQKELLLGIGKWLKVNGDAIYATRPWTKLGEGSLEGTRYTAKDIRFTTKGDTLYAIFMAWPANNEGVIASLASGTAPAGKIASVTMLGDDEELEFTQDAAGLHVKFPPAKPCEHAFVLKITGLDLKP